VREGYFTIRESAGGVNFMKAACILAVIESENNAKHA